MEENQITCPQCGLVNNLLADVCVQCGIIFVKDPAQKAAAEALDDEKRKSIEAAEAILDQTQPPAELAAPNSETISQIDPLKETVMIRIPKPEEIPPLEAESAESEVPQPEDTKATQNVEFELEAIDTDIETLTEPEDAESPISEEVKTIKAEKPLASETVEKPAGSSGDEFAATDKESSAGENIQNSKADDAAIQESENGPVTEDPSTCSNLALETERKPSTYEAAADLKTELLKLENTVEFDAESRANDEDLSVGPEIILLEADAQLIPDERDADRTEARADASTSKELTDPEAEAESIAKHEAQKARNEALKKQQEALLKAEARKKEEAAQAKAAALKKNKLARAKAEALKKQKAAQAKAEALKKKKAAQAKSLALKKKKAVLAKADALKKQKAAQAMAEKAAETVEVASGEQSNYVKLLGLLKRYKGKAIGINYDNSAEIKEAELVEANEEFFSVMVRDKKVQYSYPLKTILTIVEGEQGVETGEDNKKTRFDAIIKVYPLVLF